MISILIEMFSFMGTGLFWMLIAILFVGSFAFQVFLIVRLGSKVDDRIVALGPTNEDTPSSFFRTVFVLMVSFILLILEWGAIVVGFTYLRKNNISVGTLQFSFLSTLFILGTSLVFHYIALWIDYLIWEVAYKLIKQRKAFTK